MTETLFVYGTLMPNCPNGHVLENIVGKFVPATVKEDLLMLDGQLQWDIQE